jgi:hypothetical protein
LVTCHPFAPLPNLSSMALPLKGGRDEGLVGKKLWDGEDSVPTPAVVLDVAKLETNCKRMIETVERLGLAWRPHVKTHKVVKLHRS